MKFSKKKKKITVRFGKRLKTEMQHAITHSDYGLRGKSRWLSESIDMFVSQKHYIDLIENGSEINQAELTEVEAFYLSHDTAQKIRSATTLLRTQFPLFEGVQSAFIRACVTFRLMLKR
jgi:hypothetical protein